MSSPQHGSLKNPSTNQHFSENTRISGTDFRQKGCLQMVWPLNKFFPGTWVWMSDIRRL